MSTYTYDHAPDRYGENQQEYVQIVHEKEVPETVEKIRSAVAGKKDLKILFHEILSALAADRRDIAIKHKTWMSEYFGLRRDQHFENSAFGIDYTPLGPPYEEYGRLLVDLIKKYLKLQRLDQGPFQEKTEIIATEPPCMGRAMSVQMTILKDQNIGPNFYQYFTYEEYQRVCHLCDVPVAMEAQYQQDFNDLFMNIEALKRLKANSLMDYDFYRMRIVANSVRSQYLKFRHSDWIVVNFRYQLDDQMVDLSHYFTWVLFDKRHDSLDKMLEKSVATIIHQESLLIEPMLDDVAKIFEEAILWDGKDIQALKNSVALLIYELSHAMPFHRGSAAISEWIEMSIYQYHGFTLRYNPGKWVNLEALISPLSEFMQNYDSMIELLNLSH